MRWCITMRLCTKFNGFFNGIHVGYAYSWDMHSTIYVYSKEVSYLNRFTVEMFKDFKLREKYIVFSACRVKRPFLQNKSKFIFVTGLDTHCYTFHIIQTIPFLTCNPTDITCFKKVITFESIICKFDSIALTSFIKLKDSKLMPQYFKLMKNSSKV